MASRWAAIIAAGFGRAWPKAVNGIPAVNIRSENDASGCLNISCPLL
jgi:hypothetical protein